MSSSQRIHVIDSHTAGEPTRVVVGGGPELGNGSLFERRDKFRREFDDYRSAIVNEPRGSDILVGALLCEPVDSTCAAGVIFFNNIGCLNMCGHGAMGVAVTLAHLGRIQPGTHRLETPVGVVTIDYRGANSVGIRNVPSYRHRKGVSLDVPGFGTVCGDIAWGGNWFFLVEAHQHKLTRDRIPELTEFTLRIRRSLARSGVTGADGAEIDHIELFGPPSDPANDSRSIVLCPGNAYDRSPCGTGTSAKLACLCADGKLQPGDVWRQESIIGSVFEAAYELDRDERCIPQISGNAYVTAEATLILDSSDPFCMGIPR